MADSNIPFAILLAFVKGQSALKSREEITIRLTLVFPDVFLVITVLSESHLSNYANQLRKKSRTWRGRRARVLRSCVLGLGVLVHRDLNHTLGLTLLPNHLLQTFHCVRRK